MRVNEVMTRNVEVIKADNTLQEAAERMKALNVGPLPVSDGGRLVGMLTDRDITVRAVAEGLDPWTDHVRDIMTPAVVHCFEDQDVADAARLMQEQRIRRLPVLDRDRRLVGIVSLADLALDAGDRDLSEKTLQAVSKPAQPNR